MSKLTKIEKEYAALQDRKAALKKETNDLNIRIEDLNEQAREAAEAEDSARYSSIRDNIRRLEDELYVKKVAYDRAASGVLIKDAQEAWTEYQDETWPKVEKLLSSYRKKKDDTFKDFMEIVDLLNDIYKTRSKIAELTTANKKEFKAKPFMAVNELQKDNNYYLRLANRYDLKKFGEIGTSINRASASDPFDI